MATSSTVYDVQGKRLLEAATALRRRTGSQPAHVGSLEFQSRTPDRPCAKFCVLGEDSDPVDVTHLLQAWLPKDPLTMLSITGGAQSLDLDLRLEQIILRGLASAARSARAWLFDGGTDSGVMSLVGRAFEEEQDELTPPLIGVAPFGKITHRKSFLDHTPPPGELYGSESPVAYIKRIPNSSSSVALDPLHSHFLLVDDQANENEWAVEIALRSRVENHLRRELRVPGLLLVVGGGPGTYQNVWEQARCRSHVVVVKESGGCAVGPCARPPPRQLLALLQLLQLLPPPLPPLLPPLLPPPPLPLLLPPPPLPLPLPLPPAACRPDGRGGPLGRSPCTGAHRRVRAPAR